MSDVFTARNGEIILVSFDFSEELKLPRRPEFQYTVGEFVTIDALVYECTNAGKTAKELPENLSTTISATQDDGTVEWTCRDFSTSGSDTISSISAVTPSSGITVDSSAIVKSLYVNVTFTADAKGGNTIVCKIITVAGETLHHTYRVFIE